MLRTQIYIPKATHVKLGQLAQKQDKSMAQLVREFIENGIKTIRQTDSTGNIAIKNLFKMHVTKGPNDLSNNIDHYLYGSSKNEKR
tara:strand:- start:176 stop:433 length:258 start_codon:yes stop_codon:yes gene_type:complete